VTTIAASTSTTAAAPSTRARLRRNGEPARDVRLSLPLPVSARAAVRYLQQRGERELFDLELDLTYEAWSRARRFTVDGDGLVATLLAQRVDLGFIAVEKHWRDTIGVHLGGDYALVLDLLTLRGGLFYVTAVSTRRYAHVDFVSGKQLGASLGASVFLGSAELVMPPGS
jgi:long-subunit fatty acid transport protein